MFRRSLPRNITVIFQDNGFSLHLDLFQKLAGGRDLVALGCRANAPEVGLEPTTNRLTADRSTTELLRISFENLGVNSSRGAGARGNSRRRKFSRAENLQSSGERERVVLCGTYVEGVFPERVHPAAGMDRKTIGVPPQPLSPGTQRPKTRRRRSAPRPRRDRPAFSCMP